VPEHEIWLPSGPVSLWKLRNFVRRPDRTKSAMAFSPRMTNGRLHALHPFTSMRA